MKTIVATTSLTKYKEGVSRHLDTLTGGVMKKQSTVIMMKPGKTATIEKVDTTLKGLQDIVGGLIEFTYPPFLQAIHPGLCVLCNDEGKLNGSKPCRPLMTEDKKVYDIVFGVCAIMCEDKLGNIIDIPDDIVVKLLCYSEILNPGIIIGNTWITMGESDFGTVLKKKEVISKNEK